MIFGQTFADSGKLAEALRREEPGRRDICISAREPHMEVTASRNEFFIDPSRTSTALQCVLGRRPDTVAARRDGAHAEEVVRRRCDEPRFVMERVTEPE